MSTWAAKIEEFAKPAHKNVTVLVPNSTPEEIETVLDAIADDAQWTYKEIKEKNGRKILSYQTTRLGQFSLSGFQIIECALIPANDGIQLNIESRYIASQNKLALLVYFWKFGKPTDFFDFFGKNQENLEYITHALKMAFPHVALTNSAKDNGPVPKQISRMSLLIAMLKIWYLLIVLLVSVAAVYGIIIMAVDSYIYYIHVLK